MGADTEVVPANTTPIPAGMTAATGAVVATPVATATATIMAVESHTPAACGNCGATVSGHYCANCGQKAEHEVHSLWHFLSEVAEDLTHADSRLWQTLKALLFKPGFLTCEFLAGRRARYIPPFRLYLVTSVLLFLILALNSAINVQTQNLAQLQAQATSEEDKEELKALAEKYPLLAGEETGEKACANLNYSGPWEERVQPTLRESCLRVVSEHGHGVREAFLHNLPKAFFLLLPILALVMKPLYRRPPRYFVEHLLLLLHNHAFAFLTLALFIVADMLIPGDAVSGPLLFAIACYVPYYYYRGMRRVYREGTARTLGKLTVLSLAYWVLAGVVLVATAIYSVLVH
jgi:Protein of unknown function (DUF3667)